MALEQGRAFRIAGMDCAEEIALLRGGVGPLVGGEERLGFDLLRAKMTVAVPSTSVSDAAILAAVKSTGLSAEVWRAEGDDGSTERLRRRRLLATVVSGSATLGGFLLHAALAGSFGAALGREGLGGAAPVPFFVRLIYAVGIVAGLLTVAPKAWHSLRRLRPDMNLLMTIAVSGAVFIGEWFEAGTVAFLFSFSLALEAWSIGRARRAIAKLLDLAPPTARLLEAGGEREVHPSEVAMGARIAVRP
ncbi:MAG: hypothetical protein ABIV06_02570, partial [Thermoanaerobaculia bacterium]